MELSESCLTMELHLVFEYTAQLCKFFINSLYIGKFIEHKAMSGGNAPFRGKPLALALIARSYSAIRQLAKSLRPSFHD